MQGEMKSKEMGAMWVNPNKHRLYTIVKMSTELHTLALYLLINH